MTTTYILPGSQTKEELFSEIQDGFYIETIKHGSGLSMFTIALLWLIASETVKSLSL
jgi:TldD protein